jgi:hypothetical protein
MLTSRQILKTMSAKPMRKLGLYFLFSLGIFCMAAAILRVMLIFRVRNLRFILHVNPNLQTSFQLNQQGISAMWSIREDFVAVFVGQAPMVYPIFKRRFWTDVPTSSNVPRSSQASYEMGIFANSKMCKTSKKRKDPYSISRIVGGTTVGGTVNDSTWSESQEQIVEEEKMEQSAGNKRDRRSSMGFIEVLSHQGRESLRPQVPWESPSSKLWR